VAHFILRHGVEMLTVAEMIVKVTQGHR